MYIYVCVYPAHGGLWEVETERQRKRDRDRDRVKHRERELSTSMPLGLTGHLACL